MNAISLCTIVAMSLYIYNIYVVKPERKAKEEDGWELVR